MKIIYSVLHDVHLWMSKFYQIYITIQTYCNIWLLDFRLFEAFSLKTSYGIEKTLRLLTSFKIPRAVAQKFQNNPSFVFLKGGIKWDRNKNKVSLLRWTWKEAQVPGQWGTAAQSWQGSYLKSLCRHSPHAYMETVFCSPQRLAKFIDIPYLLILVFYCFDLFI